MNLVADSGRIDLWCAYVSESGDESLWRRYEALLSPDELARRARFRFARDRRRYLLTRALARTVLSRYRPVPAEDWAFESGPRGRPEIAAPTVEPGLQFNLSHSADLVMMGVTAGRALGIDVESVDEREADIEGLERYFAPPESAALLALPPAARRQRFLQLWTLKESYLKARGLGLAIALDAFWFELAGDGELLLHMRPQLDDAPARWQFWQLAPRAGYVAAICAARVGEGVPRILAREVVPLEREKIIEVTISRSTG
jgi:4'-phosphopantetheinyl transferase